MVWVHQERHNLDHWMSIPRNYFHSINSRALHIVLALHDQTPCILLARVRRRIWRSVDPFRPLLRSPFPGVFPAQLLHLLWIDDVARNPQDFHLSSV